MSRIGKQEIIIPKGIKVTKEGDVISVTGSKGTLKKIFRDDIDIAIGEDKIILNQIKISNNFYLERKLF
jgi:large subunit ribosomal protein L6